VNSSRFRADAGTKGGFSVINFPDNGERVRSLLCDREALARPSGMAEQHEGGDLTWVISTQKFRRVEIFQGVGRSLTRRLWRAGGTPKTHLVPLFCGAGAAGCGHKTFPVRISSCRKHKW